MAIVLGKIKFYSMNDVDDKAGFIKVLRRGDSASDPQDGVKRGTSPLMP